MLIQEDAASEPSGSTETYRVLPGPYPVIGFQYRGRLDVVRDPGARTLDRSGITGLQSRFRLFTASEDARSILVLLKPEGAYGLLGCAMDVLTDEHVGLGALVSGADPREAEERLAEAPTLAQRVLVTEKLLLTLLERSGRPPHPLVAEAARQIVREHGTERIGRLAWELGVSERYLERLFQAQVGVSPKRLASLAQFAWARARITSGTGALVAGEAGYADQAHFIRSFRAYSGLTPRQYQTDLLAEKTPRGG
jgi:AraC-like DNA-binding protein